MKIETIRKYSTRKNILIILAILILLLIFIGVTYSFYSAKVKFVNNSQTVIKTNELNLIYTGSKEIAAESIIPGDSFTKKFTVENKSNVATTFNVYMENITNEFNEDLIYILSDEDGEVVNETPLPETNNGRSYLVSNIKIESLEIKTYTLKIEFKYLDTPQNDYQGKYFKATLGIDANEIESAIPQLSCKATKCLDNDRSGDISVGDLITYDTESFYVYNNDGETIKMLAKYNLYAGGEYDTTTSTYTLYGKEATGLQDNTMLGKSSSITIAKGVTEFANDETKGINYNDYEGSLVQKYVNDYNDKLIKIGVKPKEVTLITKEELDTLYGSTLEQGSLDSWAPEWLDNTSYWTKTSYYENAIWHIISDSGLGRSEYNSYLGIRPVVIISVDEI